MRSSVHVETMITATARDSSPCTSADDWRVCLPERRRRHLRVWFFSIAAMTSIVVVIGGITRLTQSGLSIVDWHPLMGAVPPLNEAQWTAVFDRYQQFPEYQKLRSGMTLAQFKFIFFWEYLHRLAARLIGIVFLVPFLFFWRAGYFTRPLALRALGLFALGGMQGAMGWVMVRSGLIDRPSVSHYRLAAHLLLALVIFGFAVWLARELAIDRTRATKTVDAPRPLMRGLTILGGLLFLQILWGAFVAGLKAGLIFNTFPLMAGQLVPPSGLSLDPALLNLVQNMATVQWIHRLLGTVLLGATLGFFLRARTIASDSATRRLNIALLTLIAVQYLIGVLTLLYQVPVGLAAVHQATAVAIIAIWVVWMHREQNGVNSQLPTSDSQTEPFAAPG